ncbi:MAG: hypothetical protein IPH83_07250 [Gammaproteobacteria bacterium]|nr:hypothetical protein [Gammaproteobacteria bacterium]
MKPLRRFPQPPQAVRLGMISNPNSGRNRRHLSSISAMLDLTPGAFHIVTARSEDIALAMTELGRAGVNVLAINGGDGSVAHVLGELVTGTAFESPPLLCAPGGTTNVTVGDVGIRGSLQGSVLKLLAWARGVQRGARIVQRPIISVRNATGESLGCGLVFGVGAVVDGIEYWHEQVRSRGMRSELSSGVAMIRTLWGTIRGHEGFARPLDIHISTRLRCSLDGRIHAAGHQHTAAFVSRHPPVLGSGRGKPCVSPPSSACAAVQPFASLRAARPPRAMRAPRIPVITAPGWIRFSSISTARSRSTANCTTSHRAAVRCTWAWPATHVS